MDISKGDRVKFLNDTGGGTVTAIRDKKTAMVLTDDGFEVPVPFNQLIKVETGFPGRPGREREDERFFEESYSEDIEPDEETFGSEPGLTDEVLDITPRIALDDDTETDEADEERIPEKNLLLGFVGSGEGHLETWLINDSSFNVLYIILRKEENVWRSMKSGMIGPDTKLLFKSFGMDQINEGLTLYVQAIFFRKGVFNPVPPASNEVLIRPSRVHARGFFRVNDFFEEQAGIVPLVSDTHSTGLTGFPGQEETTIVPDRAATDKSQFPDVEEVDLHIEELVEDHSGLSPGEIIDIQKGRFTTALEGAIRSRTKRIIFIHGVGNGKLKYEIRRILDKDYPRLKYQDASFREYGYGATMVIIRK